MDESFSYHHAGHTCIWLPTCFIIISDVIETSEEVASFHTKIPTICCLATHAPRLIMSNFSSPEGKGIVWDSSETWWLTFKWSICQSRAQRVCNLWKKGPEGRNDLVISVLVSLMVNDGLMGVLLLWLMMFMKDMVKIVDWNSLMGSWDLGKPFLWENTLD